MNTCRRLVGATTIIVGLQFLLPTVVGAVVISPLPKTSQATLVSSLRVQEIALKLEIQENGAKPKPYTPPPKKSPGDGTRGGGGRTLRG
jgi:hypothetical protein